MTTTVKNIFVKQHQNVYCFLLSSGLKSCNLQSCSFHRLHESDTGNTFYIFVTNEDGTTEDDIRLVVNGLLIGIKKRRR